MLVAYQHRRTGRVVLLPFDPGGVWVLVPEDVTDEPVDGRDGGNVENYDAGGQPGTDPVAPPIEPSPGPGD